MNDALAEAERIVDSAFNDLANELDSYVKDRENLPASVNKDLDYLGELEEALDEYLCALEQDDPLRLVETLEKLKDLRNIDE